MKIGVLSDTHIPKKALTLPCVVLETFKGVDHIIHAGDIMDISVIKVLEQIAPVTAVAGNVDSLELQHMFGIKKILTFDGFRFGICHGDGQTGQTLDRAYKCFADDNVHCIIFGHSHMPKIRYIGNVLLFNPGSPTDKRRNTYYSFGIIDIRKDILPQILYFDANGMITDTVFCE